MAYDDFTSGKRAMDACHLMVARLGGDAELRTSMWKFDVLRSTQLNQTAVEDAVEADVIIVANARNSGLSDSVKTWIDGWAPRKRGQAAALVALLDFTDDEVQAAARTQSILKAAAAEAQMEFLPQEIRLPLGSLSPASITASVDLPRRRPVPPVIGTPRFEGWGIND